MSRPRISTRPKHARERAPLEGAVAPVAGSSWPEQSSTTPSSAVLPPPVLLADPDAATRAHLHPVLAHAGYPVLEAADGRSAFTTLTATRAPMLILLSLQLSEWEAVYQLATATMTTGGLHERHGLIVVTEGPQVLPPLQVALRLSRDTGLQLSKPLEAADVLQVLAVLRQRMMPRHQG